MIGHYLNSCEPVCYVYVCLCLLLYSLQFLLCVFIDAFYFETLTDRFYWDAWDPVHVSEAMLALGNILNFTRLFHLLAINEHLGPMLISLERMIKVSIGGLVISMSGRFTRNRDIAGTSIQSTFGNDRIVSHSRMTPNSSRWRNEAIAVARTSHACLLVSLSTAARTVGMFIYISNDVIHCLTVSQNDFRSGP